jgi:D-beta-D-heptose 7-phosphate kinase/D-beta-D-heptose 1-phosphate adenosyltransferase
VVNNIHSLGGRAAVCGVVGNNEVGKWVLSSLKDMGVETYGLVVEEGRPTTLKTRVIAHNQQVLRYDQETKTRISSPSTKRIITYIKENIGSVDGVIISDYGKGVISKELLEESLKLINQNKKVVSVDPKIDNFPFYKNITLISPNLDEAGEMAGGEILTKDDLIEAGKKLLKNLKSKMVLITQGGEGMTLFEQSGEVTHIPTVAKKVYDVTGAGDTVIASLTLGLTSGASPTEAALISNHAAGIVVGEVGTCAISPKELEGAIRDHKFNYRANEYSH